MIIFESPLTTFKSSVIFEAARAVAKIGLSQNQTILTKLSLSKSFYFMNSILKKLFSAGPCHETVDFFQVSISPTFYEQLLRTQILKAQKDSQVKQLFCAFGIFARKSCS